MLLSLGRPKLQTVTVASSEAVGDYPLPRTIRLQWFPFMEFNKRFLVEDRPRFRLGQRLQLTFNEYQLDIGQGIPHDLTLNYGDLAGDPTQTDSTRLHDTLELFTSCTNEYK